MAALAAFNAAAHDRLPAFGGTGQVTEHLRTVTGAVLDFPDMDAAAWEQVVARNFANPWWEGAPGVGVIFGPKVRHRAVQNDGVRRRAVSRAQQQEDEQLNMLRRLYAEAGERSPQ